MTRSLTDEQRKRVHDAFPVMSAEELAREEARRLIASTAIPLPHRSLAEYERLNAKEKRTLVRQCVLAIVFTGLALASLLLTIAAHVLK